MQHIFELCSRLPVGIGKFLTLEDSRCIGSRRVAWVFAFISRMVLPNLNRVIALTPRFFLWSKVIRGHVF